MTIYASFIGFITQAIINNFAPLLFLTFAKTYNLSLTEITFLTTLNFATQLIVDLLAIGFVDKIGYRVSTVLAHFLAALGLILMAILPATLKSPLTGLLIAVITYAIGGGLLEVLMSPIVEACPTKNKEKAMSMLHSFYCWGQVGVILISTLFFSLFGIDKWKILMFFWAVIPFLNMILFSKVPLPGSLAETETKLGLWGILKNRIFWLFALIMICGGASEHALAQWASSFSESALGITKTVGDITGPMLFGITMGITRIFYGKKGEKIELSKFITFSALLSMISFLIIALSPIPLVALIGFAISGFAVGIFWPGTLSLAAKEMKTGGTALFALLALAGDLGCSLGPTVVGIVAGKFDNNLRIGILWAVIFPLIMIIALMTVKIRGRKNA